MTIRNSFVRALVAAALAILAALVAISALVELPIWLLGYVEPWQYRSSDAHFSALMVELGGALLAGAGALALTRILYRLWAPSRTEPSQQGRSHPDGLDA